MIIRDVHEEPAYPLAMPSAGSLVHLLASEDPVVACKAIRDMRRLMDFYERTRLPSLMDEPGMTVNKAARTLGKSVGYVMRKLNRLPR